MTRWGARGAGRGSSAAAQGASVATGRGAAPVAAARRWATLGRPEPTTGEQPVIAPTLLAFLPLRQRLPHTAAVVTAATAAPSTSAPSGLCGEGTIYTLMMIEPQKVKRLMTLS